MFPSFRVADHDPLSVPKLLYALHLDFDACGFPETCAASDAAIAAPDLPCSPLPLRVARRGSQVDKQGATALEYELPAELEFPGAVRVAACASATPKEGGVSPVHSVGPHGRD